MGKILKYFLYGVAALVVLLVAAAVSFSLLFEPNDFRDNIADGVRDATGRELVIEGDLDVSLFPWLAIELGRTQLGNAEGFGDEPFVSFDKARLSVRVLPLLLRREVSIGTAELDALAVNLQVKRNGRSNWQDLAERGDIAADSEAPADAKPPAVLDIAGVAVTNANLRYDNAQLGERYTLTDLNFETGAVEPGEPVDVSGGFSYQMQPAETSGNVKMDAVLAFEPDTAVIRLDDVSIEGTADGEAPMTFSFTAPTIVLQTEERIADVGEIGLSLLDIDITADVESFSYADSPAPVATIQIEAFSPRGLMQRLDTEAPETADPGALSKLIIDAKAAVTERSIRLTDLELVLDDTNFKGALTVPRNSKGTYEISLAADSIDLDRYMEPADGSGGGGDRGATVPVEIPGDLIRAFNVRGSLTVEEASLGGMHFTDAKVEVNSSNGQLRMHPLSAQFFDGAYQGDIRINAAGDVPVLSVNEQIQNVSLGALATAMFEREDITGLINGTFTLEGRGRDMAEVQRSLKGNMSFVLSDGIWHGTDVWYQLRRARALFRGEQAPQPVLPAQTRFSEVSATGVVNEGVLRNDDFIAELPFMQLTGRGTVDFPTAIVDYSLSGRLLEKPEFATAATPEELEDMTEAVIPFKITGPLAAPEFKIDFGALVRERAKEEIKERVLDRLLGGDRSDEEPSEEGAEGEETEPESDPEEEIKDKLKDLLDL